MKKLYMIAATMLAAATVSMSAAGLADTQTLWGKLYTNSASTNTTKYTTQGDGVVLATDGTIITLNDVGSMATTESLLFGGEEVGKGAAYSGNSVNHSLVINKISSEGTVQWSISSTAGELDNSSSVIAATPDGGAAAFLAMRHSEGNLDKRIAIKDAKGTSHEIAFDVEARSYHAMVVKIDADGAIEWIKDIDVNNVADKEVYPKWTKNNITQGIYAYAIDVDAAGNIYVGGRMCAALTIGDTVIEPHNVDTWNGDPQTSVGNMFILKFDAKGNLVKHLESAGAATQESVRSLKVVGDKIYAFGLVAGLADTEYSLGGKSVTTTNNLISPALARLDTDLNVDYLKHYTTTKSNSTLQVPTMVVIGNNVYLMGTANFEIAIGETAYKTQHNRDAWLFCVDAATGDAKNCYIHQALQTGFFGAFEGTDGALYVAEYGLTIYNGSKYTYEGNTTIYKFNENDLSEPVDQAIFATHPSTGYGLAIDGTTLYVYDRLVYNNATGNFINSDLAFSSPSYVGRLAAYGVTVGAVEAVEIAGLEDGALSLEAGESKQLTASVLPADAANADIVWSSTNPDLVTVDANGLVTATTLVPIVRRAAAAGESEGAKAIVTATSASNPAVKTSVEVSVQQPSAVTTIEVEPTGERVVYDLMGRRVNNPQHGIYIVNGRKVIIR